MSNSQRPNILHFFVDQMRFDTIRALGNPVIKTPNLDRICREGVAFTNAFSPSPVCISARCSMIYGQYPHNTGCYENRSMPTDERQSFMGALTDAGYRTHGIGKCHFSPKYDDLRGFETREIQEEGLPEKDDYMKFLKENGHEKFLAPHGIRSEMYYIPQPSRLPAELHPTQWVGDRSSAFVEENKDSEKPWYLFSSFIHPHPPFSPPAPWWGLYRAPLMPLPNLPPDNDSLLTYINRHQNRYKYRDNGFDLNLVRCQKAFYYACISFIDYQVGRILESLDKTGQLDNTLIIFTGDHGEHLGDRRCFGKRSFHDSAARIPMLLRLPGCFEGGVVREEPVSLIDVGPTALALGNAKIKSHEPDGENMAEIVNGQCQRDAVFAQISQGLPSEPNEIAEMSQYMTVTKKWKYFYSAPDNLEFLFDKVADPLETRNRAGLTFCKEEQEYMKKMLIEHLKNIGETDGIENETWKVFPKIDIPVNPDAGLLSQDLNLKNSMDGSLKDYL